jgi:glycine dehydrogenase subunit 1
MGSSTKTIVSAPFFSGDSVNRSLTDALGINSVDDLFASIPAEVQKTAGIDLPNGLDEWDIEEYLGTMAAKNKTWPAPKYLVGSGAYRYPTPSAIDEAIGRAEFLTSYTPYQPEISQGSLQILFEYQTLVANLMGMDISNGSIYDGATALAEAAKMGVRIQRKCTKVYASAALPNTCRRVLQTYLRHVDVTLEEIPFDPNTGELELPDFAPKSVVLLGYPNAAGCFEDIAAVREAAEDACIVSYTPDPHALIWYQAPGAIGADIAVGEGQSFGIPMSFGGPYLGMFACSQKHLRQMPGRVAGKTKDADGREGYVLTLSTREQHIRREKATSNICSNQGLLTIAFTAYAASLGWSGLQKVAKRSFERRAQLEEALREKDCTIAAGNHYNEFWVGGSNLTNLAQQAESHGVRLGIDAHKVCDSLPEGRIVCAPALGTDSSFEETLATLAAL